MAGSIFKNGVWSMGFDMSPSASSVFTQQATGSASTLQLPFGTGYSWNIGSSNPAGISLGVNLATLIVGIRLYVITLPGTGQPIFSWFDTTANGTQLNLRVFPDGSLRFYLGSGNTTAIGSASATGVIQAATWVYVETKVTIAASSAGSVECRINGDSTPVITQGSVTTQSTANAWVNAMQLQNAGGTGQNTFWDDWYMLDTTGSSPLNTYLGNVQVKGDKPSANSAVSGRNAWTPTNPTNVNYTNVGNVPYNAAEYNADANPGDYDMFRFPSLSAQSVAFVNEWVVAMLDAAGSRTIELNCYSNGTDAPGAAFTPATGTPTLYNQTYVVDPHTGLNWGVAAAGSAEFGVKVQS